MGISPTQLLIVLAIVILLFGTKKLRNLGSDLGSAFKGFKKAVNDDDKTEEKDAAKLTNQESTKASEESVKEKDQA